MNYIEAMEYVESTNRFGSVLGLLNINNLLEEMGHPEEKLKIIHFAGTNGKGSTIAFVEAILCEAGYKVGKYISPVVYEYREKIQISCRYISEEEVSFCMSVIKDKIDCMIAKGLCHPTQYEIETALAFYFFAEYDCDVVLIETGLGGRLDATNVIKKPVCSVITSVSMDHMGILGDSLEKIAVEKAGIIKNDSVVISYDQDEVVRDVLCKKAADENSEIVFADFKEILVLESNISFVKFSYRNFDNVCIHLIGKHQIYNAVTAMETAFMLKRLGYCIDDDSVYRGLSRAYWGGRFEVVCREPLFIIDGAHNEEAAIALADSVRTYFIDKKIIFIVGVFGDKEYEKILFHTAGLAHTIFCITPNNIRGLSSKELALLARKYCSNVVDIESVYKAVDESISMCNKYKNEFVIVAFGSLSFLKDIKGYLNDK